PDGSGASAAPPLGDGAGLWESCDHWPVNVHVSPNKESRKPPNRRITLPAGSAAIAALLRPGGDESNATSDQFWPSQAHVVSETPPPRNWDPPNRISFRIAAL